MAEPRIFAVDDNFNLPASINVVDENLPARLGSGELDANYGPAPMGYRTDGILRSSATFPTQKLLGFFAALANRNNAPCNIVIMGDSITEGQGAASINERWVQVFLNRMRERFPTSGVTGGVGFRPTNYIFTTPANQGPVVSGNVASNGRGLGKRGKTIASDAGAGVGRVSYPPVTCSSFDVCYYSTGTGNRISVSVDGGAPTILPGAAAGNATWNSGALTPGPHAVEIAYASGGSTAVEGVMYYNGDEAKGIRLWEGGSSGSRVDFFNDSDGTGGSTAWVGALGRTNAHLIVLGWITNDVLASSARTPEQFKASYLKVIALIRAQNATAPIVLLPTFERNAPTFAPWEQYVEKLREIAEADPTVAFFDFGERIPKLSPDTFGLLADGVHPNDKGYSLMADIAAGIFSPK